MVGDQPQGFDWPVWGLDVNAPPAGNPLALAGRPVHGGGIRGDLAPGQRVFPRSHPGRGAAGDLRTLRPADRAAGEGAVMSLESQRLKIIIGGQTGVDRSTLAVGLVLGLAVGGGCSQGRRAEDGRIPDRYPLVETPERNDQTRTRRHIEDADGTLILNLGTLDGGTALAARHARQIGQPCLVVALEAGIEPATFRDWLAAHPITVPNVAGPRESQRPGVYAVVARCLETLL